MRSMCARAAGVLIALMAFPAEAVTPQEQRENCDEAAKRFEELHGRSAASEQPAVVLMYKHTFCPVQLTVRHGAAVRFLNVDRRTSHSFWFKEAGRTESERFFPGEGTSMVIDLPPGEHTYLCGPHWEHEGMVGKLTVVP